MLHISKIIALLGAEYEQYLKPGISVLVSAISTPSIDKLRFAKENSIPVVTVDWLWSCIDTGKVMPFDAHILGKSTFSQDVATNQTTDTMTLPSAVIGKSHKERYVLLSKTPKFLLNNYRSWTSEVVNQRSLPSQSAPDQSPIDLLAANMRADENGNENSAMPTAQPLREVSPEKLNSPKRSPQRPLSPEEKTVKGRNVQQISASSAKSEVLTREISEMLAAKKAARLESLPNSEEPNPVSRRNRTGLGRAPSLGFANQADLTKTTSAPAVIEQMSVSENVLLSQKVVYGDSEALERRQQLLAELKGEATDNSNLGGKATTESPVTTKRRTPANGKGRSRKRN